STGKRRKELQKEKRNTSSLPVFFCVCPHFFGFPADYFFKRLLFLLFQSLQYVFVVFIGLGMRRFISFTVRTFGYLLILRAVSATFFVTVFTVFVLRTFVAVFLCSFIFFLPPVLRI